MTAGAFMLEIAPNCETLRMPRDLSRRDPMKVAQYEVLGWRSERVTRPERDDRLPACAREAVCERRGAKRFDGPSGTGRVSRSIPGTSYRATFVESLRDRSSEARRSSLDCQLVIANRRAGLGTGSREVWPIGLIRSTRSFLVNLLSTQLPCSKKS
jgi:hypothetical protein